MLEAVWIFLIYSFLGWCCEVAFAAVCEGKFVNRGFCNGTICPIYGFGMLAVLRMLQPFLDNLLVLFLLSVAITTLIEFVAGYILEKFFHEKWWDYSSMPFNIKGYVCLAFSLLWGLACVFIVKLIHPFINAFINFLPDSLSLVLAIGLLVITIVDFSITIISVLKLNKKFAHIKEVEAGIKRISDSIGKDIADKTLRIKEKNDKTKEHIQKKILELEKLKKHRNQLLKKNFIHRRIFKAFPDIKNGRYKEIIEKLLKKEEYKNEDNKH